MKRTTFTAETLANAAAKLSAMPPAEIDTGLAGALAKLAPQFRELRRKGYTMQAAAAAASEALGVRVSVRALERALATARAQKRPQQTAHKTREDSAAPAANEGDS